MRRPAAKKNMTGTAFRHRVGLAFYGSPAETALAALEALKGIEPGRPEAVLWVSESQGPESYKETSVKAVSRLLGASFSAVVLDLHHTYNPDTLGRCQGFVWGGGLLILRLNPLSRPPTQYTEHMVLVGFDVSDVGTRAYQRLLSCIGHLPTQTEAVNTAVQVPRGTQEQAAVVERLQQILAQQRPSYTCLTADRGRGKSSAMGLALRVLSTTEVRVAITAAYPTSVQEVLRFADSGHEESRPAFAYTKPSELAYAGEKYDVILIDEAAQLPVPLLQRIVLRHTQARLVFATTIRGYEGTGRGFSLRFLHWLTAHAENRPEAKPFEHLRLTEPVRWGNGDPIEAMVYKALLLDADLAPVRHTHEARHYEYRHFDRRLLAANETCLRDLFGLLIHAHYRTTPSDLQNLLDAPNIEVHGLLLEGRVVAATMVALEGSLAAETCLDIYWGRARIRGHALAETLISHSARPDAGRLRMVRSVRIAVHPDLRRQGLATKLIGHVHAAYEPDLFGTLFGVTADLLAFRRHVGYELVRVGASRGSRTGEPAAVMIRPVTRAAHRLFGDLRHHLARDLPSQLSIMQAGNEFALAPGLEQALTSALPEVIPLVSEQIAYDVATFAYGPRTQEAAAEALLQYLTDHRRHLERLAIQESTLITTRILEAQGWEAVMGAAGLPSIPATMRALRRAVRQFVELVDPELKNLVGTYPPESTSTRQDSV